MTRRQWMWLWIWLLLFFIIFCVWNKLQSFKTAEHTGIAAPVVITDQNTRATPEHNITKDISVKITKDGDIVKLAGVFPSQEAVDQAIEALRFSAQSVQKGTIIIDPKADNPKLRALISDFAKELPKFSKAVIEYHEKSVRLDGITSDKLAKEEIEATAKSLGTEYQIENLVSLQTPPAPKVEPLKTTEEAQSQKAAPQTAKSPKQNQTMPAGTQKAHAKATPQKEPVAKKPAPKTKKTNAQQALNKVLKGKRITFLYASDTLTPKSKKLLDQIAKILKRYPDIRVEIGGHTDSDGTKARNMKLSQRRAYAVKLYLVQKGINSKRLVARGYGESRPLVKNDTPAHKQQNRRVEFKVIP